jgi:hypothetical protein
MKLILILMLIAGSVFADEVIGLDGDCQVYFRPGYGVFEVCDQEPVFLGQTIDTVRFRHRFHRGPAFHRHWEGRGR